MEIKDPNECYTVQEAVKILKITRQTLTNWRKKGILKVVKRGTKVLIRKEEVARFLKENEK